MALTVEALKGLYEKLGGTDFGNVTTIPEAIDKVTEVAEAGGGGSITVDDKIQADSTNPVENGAIYEEFEDVYAKIQLATPLIVHGTADYLQSTATITDSITLAEIYSAAAAGRYVAFECSLEAGNTTRLTLAGYTEANDEYTIVFSAAAEQNRFPAVVSAEFENSLNGTFIYAVPDANP